MPGQGQEDVENMPRKDVGEKKEKEKGQTGQQGGQPNLSEFDSRFLRHVPGDDNRLRAFV